MEGAKKKMKNRGARGTTGRAKRQEQASRFSFSLPSVPRALSFLFSPGCSRLLFTSPHFPVRTKKKTEASAEERDAFFKDKFGRVPVNQR